MSIGNHVYNMYFFLNQYSVSLDWRLAAPSSTLRRSRFLTTPPDGGFVRNDKVICCSVKGKQWLFAERIATAFPMLHKVLSFRALARNLIINYFEIIID